MSKELIEKGKKYREWATSLYLHEEEDFTLNKIEGTYYFEDFFERHIDRNKSTLSVDIVTARTRRHLDLVDFEIDMASLKKLYENKFYNIYLEIGFSEGLIPMPDHYNDGKVVFFEESHLKSALLKVQEVIRKLKELAEKVNQRLSELGVGFIKGRQSGIFCVCTSWNRYALFDLDYRKVSDEDYKAFLLETDICIESFYRHQLAYYDTYWGEEEDFYQKLKKMDTQSANEFFKRLRK